MQIIESVSELLTYVENGKQKGLKSGLVPTMGALHEGHLSLVRQSVKDNDVTIVSLFVNPVQFNNPKDLETYPRQPEQDFQLLAREGVDVVFAPVESEIYPEGFDRNRKFNLGMVAEVMEGKHRPGHFQGVALVVNRLFQLCRPTRAYFGLKDFQQIAVIREMLRHEDLDVEIVPCPIVREESGLALSSRNMLLSPAQRREAAAIHAVLKESVDFAESHSVEETRRFVVERLDAKDDFKVEYFEIVDGLTLLPVEEWTEAALIVGCITVYVGNVRLIDNIQYKQLKAN